MQNVTAYAEAILDPWPYVEAITDHDLDQAGGVLGPVVEYVYRNGTNRIDQLLIPTRTENIYLILVLDLPERRIVEYHLLNLNEKYGLSLTNLH